VLDRSRLDIVVFTILALSSCGTRSTRPDNGTALVPMRDGVTLATDLYFPDSNVPPYPTVLIRTPYNKRWLEGYGTYYARSGFAVAIQDVRGRWESEGEWEPFVHEGADGYDTIEWLAAREWSTGKIGMVGGSYSGTVQFAAAIERPPHLVTIVPNVAAAMPFDNVPREGGVLALGWAIRWTDIVENARTGQELQAKVQASITQDWTRQLSGLPIVELDSAVVGRDIPYFNDWASHQPEDQYWNAMSYLSALDSIEIPVFLQSGWFDPGSRGARLAFEHLTKGVKRPIRLLLGPWPHGDQGTRYIDGVDMGAAAERDLMAEYRQWLDYWLTTDASDAPAEPGVEVYVMGANRWLSGHSYPLDGTSVKHLYLASGASDSAVGGLEWDPPSEPDAFDRFTYDPGAPTPSFHAALKRGALAEYRQRISSGRDVLVYETPPLDQSLHLIGPIEATIYASSSAPDTDWVATLYGITESGEERVIGLTFGILRARYRESMMNPSPLQPGTVYPFVIDLGHTAVTIEPGERLRLEIASAAFPEFSRNLNTGGNNELGTEWVEAEQRVYRTSMQPSHVLLPIIERLPSVQ